MRVLLGRRRRLRSAARRTRAGKRLNPNVTYSVHALGERVARGCTTRAGRKVGSFACATQRRRVGSAGRSPARGGTAAGWSSGPPAAGGVETVDALGPRGLRAGGGSAPRCPRAGRSRRSRPRRWRRGRTRSRRASAARYHAVRRHPLADVPRGRGRDGLDQRGGGGDARADRDLPGPPRTTYFSSSRAVTPRTSRTPGPARRPSRGCKGVPDPYDGAGGNPEHRWTHTLAISSAGRRARLAGQGAAAGHPRSPSGASRRAGVAAPRWSGPAGRTERHRSPAREPVRAAVRRTWRSHTSSSPRSVAGLGTRSATWASAGRAGAPRRSDSRCSGISGRRGFPRGQLGRGGSKDDSASRGAPRAGGRGRKAAFAPPRTARTSRGCGGGRPGSYRMLYRGGGPRAGGPPWSASASSH